MRQKVIVRAIVRDSRGRTLFLRRYSGRPSVIGKYELPGGKVQVYEQPIDAMTRLLKMHTGLVAETAQLFDVITFIDPDDKETQYTFIIFLVGLSSHKSKVVLDNAYDKYIWKKTSELQLNTITNSTHSILWLDREDSQRSSNKDNVKYDIFCDGGSRGNPGPSAAGFIIMKDDEIVHEDGLFLGLMDNNTAEYLAVYLSLRKALSLGYRDIELRSDSLLVINQISGLYHIRNDNQKFIHDKIIDLIKDFNSISFHHIKREFNKLADGVVNKILDEKLRER